jgi:hypothetical protein
MKENHRNRTELAKDELDWSAPFKQQQQRYA